MSNSGTAQEFEALPPLQIEKASVVSLSSVYFTLVMAVSHVPK